MTPRASLGGVSIPATRAGQSPLAGPGGSLLLTFRIERDGETVFAPRVRVASGEAFEVQGGGPISLAPGQLHDGLTVAGTARNDGRTIWLDLSVQSGRALGRSGRAVYVIDRFRQGISLAPGREIVLDLFDDVPAAAGGRLRLRVTAVPE